MKNADKTINPIVKGTLGNQEDFGLTKREYFVAQAMQGILAGNSFVEISRMYNPSIEDFVAVWSTNIADKVLEHLEETEQENKQ
ncbi:hypothetical protein [Ornithobacterium rhinotracheale]|uniref:hypothetical protein n=1 Tax=Ornithobacterium rhinotracheale TaxID=28251 RepID=UPI001FF63BF6|nr:hypothetical protein [Ornithobacterium rhinotracheale]MCK0201340.1 hypothetical protein [Ornithobacterium rhinotracheale]